MRSLFAKLATASLVTTSFVVAAPVLTLPTGHAPAPEISQRAPERQSSREAVITDSRPFTVLGVTWRQGTAAADTVVRVRYRADGAWTGWQDLEVQEAAAPRERTARRKAGAPVSRAGTEPLVAVTGTAYDVRVTSARHLPKDIKVMAVDSSKTTGAGAPPAGTAAAEGSRPGIYSRASWGADESLRTCDPGVAAQLKAVAVHHTAGTNGYTAAQVPSIINGIYSFHTKGRGWCDIGYNVLVDRFGRLWEGRYGGLDRNIIPAAQEGFNTSTSAISAIGNYDTVAAPAAMVDSIARFASWRLGLGHVDPKGSTTLVSGGGSTTRYAEGTAVRLPTIFAHRNTGLTECPGRYLYAQMATIRTKARAYSGSAAIFDPTGNFWRLTTTDLPAFRINAHTPSWQRFTLTVTSVDTGGVVYQSSGTTYENAFSAVWDRRDGNGRLVPAGSYVMRITSSSSGANASPYSTTVQLVGDAPPPGDPALPDPTYRTPGTRYSADHVWSTSCGRYSTGTRCHVLLRRTGQPFRGNNWSYFDQGYAAWAGNPLATPGRWTSGGRTYSTTCSPNAANGARSCRTVVWNAPTAQWVISSMVWLGDGR
jgi:hypothetical protein